MLMTDKEAIAQLHWNFDIHACQRVLFPMQNAYMSIHMAKEEAIIERSCCNSAKQHK